MTPNTLTVTHWGKCAASDGKFMAWIDLANESRRELTYLFNYHRPSWQSTSVKLPIGSHNLFAQAEMSATNRMDINTGLVEITVLSAPDDEIRIMPLGDSITKGLPTDFGYRKKVCEKLLAGYYRIAFVGSEGDNDSNIDDKCKHHEGHSGYTSLQISNNLSSWLNDYNPHIVLLHIGINDIRFLENTSDTDQRILEIVNTVKSILDKIDEHNPDTVVFLARIIKTTDPNINHNVSNYNRQIESMACRRIAESRDRIIVVDMENSAGLSYERQSIDFNDFLHPNDSGYEKIADLWLGWLKSFLPR